MSNVYTKMQEARVELQEMNIKKTGKNTFSNYTYYELGDVLPHINNLLKKHKLFSVVNFGSEVATLTIINSEKIEEKIEFTSTVAEANLKGCHAIQNLGAVQTYLRRYLYMNAFEIVEHDVLDATTDTKKPVQQKKSELSDKQVTRLYAIAKNAGITEQQVKAVIKKEYNKDSTKELTKKEYDAICERMEAKANEKKGNEPTSK